MPTYDFECTRCSNKFEKRRSFSDNSPVPCPDCGSESEQRISPVPIIFKGSGFYITDHRSGHGHSEPVESSDDSDKAKTESSEKSKTENTEKPKIEGTEKPEAKSKEESS